MTAYKIVVDPRPTASGEVIVYAALSDLDANGNLVTAGAKGGIWKSLDTGTTWTQMRAGQATDVVPSTSTAPTATRATSTSSTRPSAATACTSAPTAARTST